MSIQAKILSILSVIVLTMGYGLYERGKYSHLETARDLILQSLPVFTAEAIESDEVITNENLFQEGDRAAMVHLWATWCGVCKDGMPGLISFAERLEPLGIQLLLLAVNDEEREVSRFLSRFDIPRNVSIGIDNDDRVLDRFGSVRVPETYLFAANGKHLNKFVGPQEWSRPTYFERVNRLVENELRGRGQEIEAHQ